VLAIIVPTVGTNTITNSTEGQIGANGAWIDTNSVLSFGTTGTEGYIDYTISNPNSLLTLDDVFGTNPYQPTKNFYLLGIFTDIATFSASAFTGSRVKIVELDNLMQYTGMPFNHAETPWFSNDSGTKLFKFHHVGDGDYTNREIKIAIERMNTSSTL